MSTIFHRDETAVATAVCWQGYLLFSHFQPIVSLPLQRTVGFEALMRARDSSGQAVSPLALIDAARARGEALALDRCARQMHLRYCPAVPQRWLFLNMLPEAFVDAASVSSFLDELARCDIAPHGIVIEVLESALAQDAALIDAVASLRAAGLLLALDDFGAGHSNFDRIWKLRPDIVKLDRSFALSLETDPLVRRLLPRIVSLLHEAGALVVLEGIETEAQAEAAVAADVDLVQGYFFAKPSAQPETEARIEARVAVLWERFATHQSLNDSVLQQTLVAYRNALGQAAVLLAQGLAIDLACSEFLQLPQARFCFLLGEDGRQIGPNVWSPHYAASPERRRFAPLHDTSRAVWLRRPYFRRAIERAFQVQTSRPYLSATTAQMCVTLSVSFPRDGRRFVLCGDVAWDEKG